MKLVEVAAKLKHALRKRKITRHVLTSFIKRSIRKKVT